MATGNNQLSFAIRAVNEAQKELRAVQQQIKDIDEGAGKASSGGLAKVQGALGGLKNVAIGLGATAALGGMAGLLVSAARAAAEDEAATKRLDQALRNVGGAFDENKAKIEARIKAGADLAFSDDAVRDSFQTLLAATGDVDEALRRQALAMDFARGAGIPLEQASKLLGKVTEENVEVFKRMGITIGEGATEAEAFAVIQGKFAGQSEAYAKSTAGQFEQSKIKMGELKEQLGAALLPAMAAIATFLVEDVIPALERFGNWWAENGQPKVAAFVGFIRDVVMPEVKKQFAKFMEYYESDIKPALDNVKTAIEEVVTFIIEHWGKIEPFVKPIFVAIETAFKVMTGAIKIAIDLLGGDWKGAWNNFKVVADDVLKGVLTILQSFERSAGLVISGVKHGFKSIGAAIKEGFRDAVNEVIGLINAVIEAYNRIPKAPNIPAIPTIPGPAPAPPGPVYGPDPPPPDVYGPMPPVDTPYVGSFDEGTPYVPRTGWAMVHKGEAIIPAGQRNGGTTIVIQALDAQSVRDWLNRGGGDEIEAHFMRRRAFA